MAKIFEGIYKFKNEDFEKYKHIFENLKNKQNPHTLFIGCADSRIIPNLITKTMPGELFTVRNIANLVPPYRDTEEYVATTSAVEYAVLSLNVENIVVCGHSNCGGCYSAIHPDLLTNMPHVKKWIELINPAVEEARRICKDNDELKIEMIVEQLNIVNQIKNLLTYPFIKERYEKGMLNIYGWYYIIESGDIYNYNISTGTFELITDKEKKS